MTTPHKSNWEDGKVVEMKARNYGKRYAQDMELLDAIHEAEKYVVHLGVKGTVHIIPDAKLKALLTSERQALVETMKEAKKKPSRCADRNSGCNACESGLSHCEYADQDKAHNTGIDTCIALVESNETT